MDFVHLHVHSHYSLLDGLNRIDDLIARAKAQGMKALALTDHGNLYGAYEFYSAARAANLKPILGMEAYISPTTRQDKSMGNQSKAAYHLLLLAVSREGWHNLMTLSSRAFLEGFYYKPRIDRELLAGFNKGLVCTTGCLAGEICSALLGDDYRKARRIAGEYLDIFGRDRFFIEIMNQGEPDQKKINPGLVRLAKEIGAGLVGTNDVHFLTREDKMTHKVLTCISTNKLLTDTGGLEYSPELYLKDGQEMRTAMQEWPEALHNTLKIAEMCDMTMEEGGKHLPVFHPPDGMTSDAYLNKLAREGIDRRFKGGPIPKLYADRLQWELDVIAGKGYSSYFLIVNDFVQFARRNNIPAGPRGSGVATLVGYVLGIANIDPLRYGLLFERFTDPQREEDPDIDIDICQEGRARIIQYVRQQYGHVAQIITYGTLKARNAIRDVGRVMDVPLPDVDRIAKLVPEDPKMNFKRALEEAPDLKNLYDTDPTVRQLIDYARNLEGLARHSGVHAAGVVVCDEPLENYVPLCKQADSDDVIIQWDHETCGKAGMMKMDFLGLRTLTIIECARQMVKKHRGQDIDPEELPLDDEKVFEIFRQGYTDGVFQFEKDGMKNVLRQMRPNRIEDLIAANALYRPGSMEVIPSYCRRKNKQEPIESIHCLVDDILTETYGLMVYQEQVMQVLNRLGKIPLSKALTLIKAISKKKLKIIEQESHNFIAGAKGNGIDEQQAHELFALIKKFADYGFNKAHSTRYAIIAYQAAYFKAYYPQEFIAATLTYECPDQEKLVQYMAEAARLGVVVAPPDINSSGKSFTIDGKQVRFGLMAVKGVGESAVDAILLARAKAGRFQNIFHFCEHVDLRAVNRSTIEALIKCGAFDSAGSAHRAAMIAAIDHAIQSAQSIARDRERGQMNFFDTATDGKDAGPVRYPDVPVWTIDEVLAAEKEILGFYLSSHPIRRFEPMLACINWPHGFNLALTAKCPADTRVGAGCLVIAIRSFVPRKSRAGGRSMAMLTLEDGSGKVGGVVFADYYEKLAALLNPDALLYITGTVDQSRSDRLGIRVDNAYPIETVGKILVNSVRVSLPAVGVNPQVLEKLKGAIRKHPGECQISFDLCLPNGCECAVNIQTGSEYYVAPTIDLYQDLIKVLNGIQVKFTIREPAAVISRSKRDYYRNGAPQ